ncbi:uncharacterized protein LOC133335361 [Musca vetustissima]|uniref:uncharacterized protein LOC133335361 n=1 Tax=Musca vetustissima TaxID=27455 RepID=UPI002AB676BE|nr:uncharacterized protein LOC133335361 [Musca vetustissima]
MSEGQQDEPSDIEAAETETESEEQCAGTKDNTIIEDNTTKVESENVNLLNEKSIPAKEDNRESVTETRAVEDNDKTSKSSENVCDKNKEELKKLDNNETKETEYNAACETTVTENQESSGKTNEISDSEVTVKENPTDECNENSKIATDSNKISQSSPSKEVTSNPQKSTDSTKNSPDNKTAQENPTSETASKTSTNPSKDDYAEHVTYTDDGNAIYTDPATKYQYKWCTKTNNWIPAESQTTPTADNPYENEHYKWCQETQKWIPKQVQVTETDHYKWDSEKQQWIPKNPDSNSAQQSKDIVYDIDEDGQRIYTDRDGTVYFWDVEKNAWFPKIDEDFMARYQMNYGFIDNTTQAENEKKQQEIKAAELKEKELQKMTEEAMKSSEDAVKGPAKRKAQEPPKWFEIDPEHNTKVYVSNLPLDITMDEFAELMGKCGMIMRDPQSQKLKLKLYAEADGQLKGDGLCDYIKVNVSLSMIESIFLYPPLLGIADHKLKVRQES